MICQNLFRKWDLTWGFKSFKHKLIYCFLSTNEVKSLKRRISFHHFFPLTLIGSYTYTSIEFFSIALHYMAHQEKYSSYESDEPTDSVTEDSKSLDLID